MRQSALTMQIKGTQFNYNCVLTEELGIINDVSLVKGLAEYITYSLAFHFYSLNVQSSLLHTWYCASTTEMNNLNSEYHIYIYSKEKKLLKIFLLISFASDLQTWFCMSEYSKVTSQVLELEKVERKATNGGKKYLCSGSEGLTVYFRVKFGNLDQDITND